MNVDDRKYNAGYKSGCFGLSYLFSSKGMEIFTNIDFFRIYVYIGKTVLQ